MKFMTVAITVLAAAIPAISAAELPLRQQIRVKLPSLDPAFESICHVLITRRVAFFFTRIYTGSAVLYRERYLLTAGHNVYQDRSHIRQVEVRCGVGDAETVAAGETIAGWQALDADGYRGKPFSRDFGVIRLDRPIAVSRPFALAPVAVDVGAAIRFAGYPGGAEVQCRQSEAPRARGADSGQERNGCRLFAADGVVTRVADGLAYYDIETFKSNSGGPVWRDVGGVPTLVAVHVTNSGGRIVDADYRLEVDRLIDALDRRASDRGL